MLARALEMSMEPGHLEETPEAVNQSYGQELISVETPDVDYTIQKHDLNEVEE